MGGGGEGEGGGGGGGDILQTFFSLLLCFNWLSEMPIVRKVPLRFFFVSLESFSFGISSLSLHPSLPTPPKYIYIYIYYTSIRKAHLIPTPNQQRTLNKLPTELRCRNFVNKLVCSYKSAPNMQSVYRILTELLPLCLPPWVVGHAGKGDKGRRRETISNILLLSPQ